MWGVGFSGGDQISFSDEASKTSCCVYEGKNYTGTNKKLENNRTYSITCSCAKGNTNSSITSTTSTIYDINDFNVISSITVPINTFCILYTKSNTITIVNNKDTVYGIPDLTKYKGVNDAVIGITLISTKSNSSTITTVANADSQVKSSESFTVMNKDYNTLDIIIYIISIISLSLSCFIFYKLSKASILNNNVSTYSIDTKSP